jgi:hypothetical protein
LARRNGRRRTADEIRSILDCQHESGLSLLAFARKQGLCYASLRRWHARHGAPAARAVTTEASSGPGRPEGGYPAFVPVELDAETPTRDFILEWSSGRSLRIPAGFNPEHLRRLLDVLGVRP